MSSNPISLVSEEVVLDEFTRVMVDGKLQSYCERRLALRTQNQVALSYAIMQASVILYEQRRSRLDPQKISRAKKVARADFDEDSRIWTLWAYDRNDRRRRYPGLGEAMDFDKILGEIDRDPQSMIWR